MSWLYVVLEHNIRFQVSTAPSCGPVSALIIQSQQQPRATSRLHLLPANEPFNAPLLPYTFIIAGIVQLFCREVASCFAASQRSPKAAGAAIFARTAREEANAETAEAADFAHMADNKPMQRLRGRQYLHAR
jgi:hypothetical protein